MVLRVVLGDQEQGMRWTLLLLGAERGLLLRGVRVWEM